MALKLNHPNENTAQNAGLALIPQSMSAAIAAQAPRSGNNYLPRIELTAKGRNAGKLRLAAGDKSAVLGAGTRLSAVAFRPAVKVFGDTKDGSVCSTAYAAVDGCPSESHALYERLMQHPKAAPHTSWLVVGLTPDGKAFVGALECSSRQGNKYVSKLMSVTDFSKGLGVRIDIDDHTCNVTSYTAGHEFLAHWLLEQFEVVSFTADEQALITDAVNAAEAQIKGWLSGKGYDAQAK